MNSYSKIRHGSLDLTSSPNPNLSPIQPLSQNPNLSPSQNPSFRRSRSSASARSGEDGHKLSGLQAAVTRVFSMRRNPTVGNGYWRIHDGGDGVFAEEEEGMRWRKKGLRRKGFFGICRKFVGF